MRFSYAEVLTDAHFQIPLARAAEAAGYDSMTVTDSVIYPKESDAAYPYTASGSRNFIEDKDVIETMVQCAQLLAVTTTLRIAPFVLKLPIRPPVLVAKQAASLAYLSGNRLDLGVGISPWPEDFAAFGVPWERRGKRMDECMDIIRGLTRPGGGYFSYSGDFYEFPAVKQVPAPTEPIPLLVGGHADGALRRAARRGDGWMMAGGDTDDLDTLLERLRVIRAEENDTRDDFKIYVGSRDAFTLDGVKRLEDKGVTDCIVGFRNPYTLGPDREPLDDKIRNLETYAEAVIGKIRDGSG